MSNYSLLDTLNGSRWDISSNNIYTVGSVSCNGGTAIGTYYSNNVSAFRIPTGATSSRPVPGLAGYLRYNTDTSYNCLEYYDPNAAIWIPIYPTPSITSINPNYVTDASGATTVIAVSGYGYVPGATVSYRGTDLSIYAAPSTTFVSNTLLNATVPASVYSTGFNIDPFTIIVTNPSGISGFLPNALDVDPLAVWQTPAGTLTSSLSTTSVDSSFTLTTSSSPYFRVLATDVEGGGISYSSPDISSNSATSNLTITTSGGYGYITGTPYTLTNATVSFTIIALDLSHNIPIPRNFSLTVNAALRTAQVSSSFSYQVGYTDSAGANYTTSGPYPGGYTVYTFNPNASSAVLVPISPQSAGTFQSAVATYTFTPNFASSTYSVLVVGGGGAGAGDGGTNPPAGNGGGGGGGVLYNTGSLTMTNGTTYTITVGAGAGIGSLATQSQLLGGANSSITGSGFTTLTANGGGGGGYWSNNAGQAGGCGGGGAQNAGAGSATQGSTATATGAGNAGAAGSSGGGGGGGGAGAPASSTNGGNGISNSITGSAVFYGGGGGGTGNSNGSGGSGGGTAGAQNPVQGTNGLGGGSGAQISGGNTARGGSGIVVIRFKSYTG
jgi:hypothetical protein